ncbi:MAG TPA: DUF2182 domain-containing protein, partial [Candidatus Saccharimonadales bacterium]|nr:DUF2182 domain-containing protein [Candidatus Saccharimonadales bacterium]
MPGAWTMSMAWMRMPGQSWPGAAATFLGMWVVMMLAMMLPSLVPVLWSRRAPPGTGALRDAGLAAVAAAGYFCVWAVLGACVYPPGLALAAAEMRWPSLSRWAPAAAGVALLLAGGVQLTDWKARHLACCRSGPACGAPRVRGARDAWREGLRLGAHCGLCCAGYMAALLVCGVMDLGVMTAVAAGITVERLALRPRRVARIAGAIILAAGALSILRALRAA